MQTSLPAESFDKILDILYLKAKESTSPGYWFDRGDIVITNIYPSVDGAVDSYSVTWSVRLSTRPLNTTN